MERGGVCISLYLPVTQPFRELSPVGREGQYHYYKTDNLKELLISNKVFYTYFIAY